MKAALLAATSATALLCAPPAPAQSPLTPVRPLSSPSLSSQWLEPPPADKPASAGSASGQPAAADRPTVTAAAEPPPPLSPAPSARDTRTVRRAVRSSGGSTANRLNHQELARVRSGGGYSYPTSYPSYSLWPFRLF